MGGKNAIWEMEKMSCEWFLLSDTIFKQVKKMSWFMEQLFCLEVKVGRASGDGERGRFLRDRKKKE